MLKTANQSKWLKRLRKQMAMQDKTDYLTAEDLPSGLRNFFEERAAIREFDGNMSRQDAESGAWDDIQPYIDTEKWSFNKWIDGFGYCPGGHQL